MSNINQLRMRTIYGGNTNPTNVPLKINTPNDDNSPEGYEPHHEMYDKMVQTANRMPHRAPMSGLQKVGSAVSRLAGFGPSMYDNAGNALGLSFNQNQARESQDYFENSNFGRQMTDWKQEYDVSKDLTNEEQQQNTNSRILHMTQQQRDIQKERADAYESHYKDMSDYYDKKSSLSEQELAQKKKEFEDKKADLETKNKIAQKRADAYARNTEGWKLQLDKDGKYYWTAPGKPKEAADIEGYTEEDKQRLIGKREKDVQQDKAAVEKKPTPQQDAAARVNKINTILSEHPEYKDKYLEIDAATNKPTGRVINKGGDQKVFDSINSQLESPTKMTDKQMREEATRYLNDNKLPVTEANIAHYLKSVKK